jgi:hypothetical protein
MTKAFDANARAVTVSRRSACAQGTRAARQCRRASYLPTSILKIFGIRVDANGDTLVFKEASASFKTHDIAVFVWAPTKRFKDQSSVAEYIQQLYWSSWDCLKY